RGAFSLAPLRLLRRHFPRRRRERRALSPLHAFGHGAVDVAFLLALGDGLAFVGVALALAEADLELGVAIEEEELEGDQGHALALGGSGETFDLGFVGQ